KQQQTHCGKGDRPPLDPKATSEACSHAVAVVSHFEMNESWLKGCALSERALAVSVDRRERRLRWLRAGVTPMISQFFEIQIREGHLSRYMDLAAALKPSLDNMGGCLFIDRFKSLTRENLVLSYQIWQDEGSMTAWRVDASHHRVQEIGRERNFFDYRILVAHVNH